MDASPTASSSTSTRPPGGTKWVDEFACSALCQLILDDRSCGVCERRRRALPPFLYVEAIAPYLRFEELLPNMLYAFGGRNQEQGPLDTVEVFNTWHGRWVPGPSMPKRRAGSAAAVLDDGRMMIIGGYTEQGIAQGLLASCDVFDPATEHWTEDGAAPLSRARWGHGCACLQGKVYVVGGCSLQLEAQAQEAFMVTLRHCEIYLPKENRWIAAAPLQIARSGTRVVALDDSHLAAIGGCDDVFGRAETQPTVELFDARTQVWSVLEHRLSFPRTTAGAAALAPEQLLVVGGAPSLCTAEVYRVRPGGLPSLDSDRSESKVADLSDGRMGCQAAVLSLPAPGKTYPVTERRCVVVIGGERSDESAEFARVRQLAAVPVYDAELGEWREENVVPPLPSARTAVAVCVGLGRAELPAREWRRLPEPQLQGVPYMEEDDMETDEAEEDYLEPRGISFEEFD